MSLSERVKRAAEFSDKASEHIHRAYEKDRHRFLAKNGIGLFTCGAAQEAGRVVLLIEALAECAEVLEYATGPTRDVKTPKMILALTRLEAVLTEMEKG